MKQLNESTALELWRIVDTSGVVWWVNPSTISSFRSSHPAIPGDYIIYTVDGRNIQCEQEQLDQHMRCDFEVTNNEWLDDTQHEPSWLDYFKQLIEDYHATNKQDVKNRVAKEVFDTFRVSIDNSFPDDDDWYDELYQAPGVVPPRKFDEKSVEAKAALDEFFIQLNELDKVRSAAGCEHRWRLKFNDNRRDDLVCDICGVDKGDDHVSSEEDTD